MEACGGIGHHGQQIQVRTVSYNVLRNMTVMLHHSSGGGYVNTLYIVENKKCDGDGPKKVILRHYGGNLFDMHKDTGAEENFIKNTETSEVMIFFEQSQRRLGPKLYGVFPGGRVEEFIESHTLTPEEAQEPAIMKDLAICYARYHLHDFPFPRNKLARLGRLFEQKPDAEKEKEQAARVAMLFTHPTITSLGIDFAKLMAFDFKGEFLWLFTCLQVVPTREAFVNFDTNFLNVLVREHATPDQLKTVLIDYELALYAFRGLDLGGHFVNRIIKWNGQETKASGHPFPPESQRREFIKSYVEEVIRMAKFTPDQRDTVDHVLMESDLGALFFSLFFSVIPLRHADKFLKEPSFFSILPLLQNFYIQHKKVCKEKYLNWP